MPLPSRPPSINSTSSSTSTASSNTRSSAINQHTITNTHQHHNNNGHLLNFHTPSHSTSSNQQPPTNQFQPYYEETKPFQMSDYYKYSSKHRQRPVEPPPPRFKTTRQLQNDVLKKNSIKFSSCDDQFQASVKLIEKSGQKLIEATAKAIAGNPGLAEKLNNMLPNQGEHRYQ